MGLFSVRISSTDSGDYTVQAVANGVASDLVERLQLDLRPESRLLRVIDDIQQGYGRREDLRDTGAQLWTGMLSDAHEALFQDVVREANGAPVTIELDVPQELSHLPWEAIFDETTKRFFVVQEEFRVQRKVTAARPLIKPASDNPRTPLRALVAIPDVPDLNVAQEWNNIKRIFERPEIREHVVVEQLEGRVTINRLDEALASGRYDIFHFVGHGEMDSDRNVTIRLNQEGAADSEFWANGDAFAELFSGRNLRLALLNCCYASQSSENRRTSGLGEALLSRGVGGVVAMQFEIDDDLAILFSEKFYRELLLGTQPGSVGQAVQAARRTVFMNAKESLARAFITPVLFTEPEEQPLFDVTRNETMDAIMATAISPGADDLQIPKSLINSIRNGRCLPIIGHHFLSDSASRRANVAAAGPLRLAKLLASKCEYPLMHELDMDKETALWWSQLALQRVCEYFISPDTELERIDLCDTIRDHYEACPIPKSFSQIASWNIPGAICTYFDGLLVRAFEDENRTPQVLAAAGQQAEEPEGPRLVNVFGLPREPGSIVLTETECDKLFDSLEEPGGTSSCMINGKYGVSILMLGVSPRDPTVRRLASILLRADAGRGNIPIHFVDPVADPLTRLFWRRFDVRWNESDPERVVEQLTAIAMEDSGQ